MVKDTFLTAAKLSGLLARQQLLQTIAQQQPLAMAVVDLRNVIELDDIHWLNR